MRYFLLVPCLLICLGCATPSVEEQLEEGLTKGQVHTVFGAPKSFWIPDIVGHPPKPGVIEQAWAYQFSRKKEIHLYFEVEKLAWWRVPNAIPWWSRGGGAGGLDCRSPLHNCGYCPNPLIGCGC
jgi:hypothetical protein